MTARAYASGSIETVAVIGAGTMGRGIAQVVAQAGYDTWLHDADGDALDAALAAVEATLEKGVARGKVNEAGKKAALSRLHAETDFGAAVAAADLVVEAVPEEIDLKRRIFADLDARCDAHTLLASNTSSLSIGEIGAATGRPDRVLGLHFFNPVHIMRLVEIVVSEATDPAVLETAKSVVRTLGKEPIVVRDVPGFATSRLGVSLGLEAMRMLEDGVATARDIDVALELGYNHPMGPLKLTDLVGLDIRLAIAEHLAETIDSARFAPPQILKSLVAEGKLGRKTGEGFYIWRDGEPVPKKFEE